MIDDPKKHIEMPPLPEEPAEQSATDEAIEVPEPTQVEVAQAAPAPIIDQPTPQESWKAVREKTQRLERELEQTTKRLQAYEASQQKQSQPEEAYGTNLAADQIVEGKHYNEMQKELREVKKELSSYKQQTTLTSAESRLKSQFPDIDTVVSAENIERLREEHPEVAMTLKANPDFYSQAAAAYKVIKSLGIYQDPKLEADRLQAQKNAAKPRPLTSVSPQQGDTPMSRANAFANGLTPELSAQLRKEMEDSRRGY